jgi:hypothetical protein
LVFDVGEKRDGAVGTGEINHFAFDGRRGGGKIFRDCSPPVKADRSESEESTIERGRSD